MIFSIFDIIDGANIATAPPNTRGGWTVEQTSGNAFSFVGYGGENQILSTYIPLPDGRISAAVIHTGPDAPIAIAQELFEGPADAVEELATEWLNRTVSEFMLEEQPVPA